MRELVDGDSTIRHTVSEEVIRCFLARVHHRLPSEPRALWKPNDHRQVAGVEGHIDLAFGFILLQQQKHKKSLVLFPFDAFNGRKMVFVMPGDDGGKCYVCTMVKATNRLASDQLGFPG